MGIAEVKGSRITKGYTVIIAEVKGSGITKGYGGKRGGQRVLNKKGVRR